ncbi:MAG: polymer-forming cytoskeletal protein [Myxococcales bacterium]|nr:polymer-forming cytoskeletal protein [Myxococcales bacterium]
MPKSSNDGTVLGHGLRVRGRVRGDGDLCIEAQIDGDVSVTGLLELRDGARIRGTVSAASVIVGGELEGNLDISGPVSVTSTGVLRGDVSAASLSLDEGGTFQGLVQADFDLPDAIA